jgi:hypothetical protein
MRTILVLFSLLVVTSLSTPSSSGAQDCQPRRLRDGTWTADCPSSQPQIPSSTPPIFDAYCDVKQYGWCSVRFEILVEPGTRCYCTYNGGTIWGSTR